MKGKIDLVRNNKPIIKDGTKDILYACNLLYDSIVI